MKKKLLVIVCLISILISINASAAYVSKVVITTVEPVVGERHSFKASVPQSASTEVYEVHWAGEFDNGVFVQGYDYTITVKLRIKAGLPNNFATSSKINATINGKKAKVNHTTDVNSSKTKTITVRYTWKTLGGENPNDPKYKLKTKLEELSSAYNATNATTDKELLKYLQEKLYGAEIWSTGGNYAYTRKLPSDTKDGIITVPIGIRYEGATLDRYNFTVVLPALNKSPEAANLSSDMALMKKALTNLSVTSKTTGEDVLAVANAAAIHGTKALWDKNYKYNAPTANYKGSIEGKIIIALGDKKDIISVYKVLPVDGYAADTAIDADFSALSKALHNFSATNRTTQEEVINVANASIKNGSKLTITGFTKTDTTYDNEDKIVMTFAMELKDKTRAPRIVIRMSKLRPAIPTGISVTQDEWEVLRLTNIERYKAGVIPLVMVAPLQDGADIRSKELITDYRYDHLRPDGSKFSTAIDPSFIKNRVCGENGYQGEFPPSRAVDGWMKSPGHRANMLKADYSYFGAGVHPVGSYKYWI